MPVVTRAQKRTLLQTRTETANEDPTEDSTDTACPVCHTEIDEDRCMMCSNGHAVDFKCVRKMAVPVSRSSPGHSGLQYRCPICRDEVSISLIQMMGMLKNSAEVAMDTFGCSHAITMWQCDCYKGHVVRRYAMPL